MAEYNMPQYILREFKVTDARVSSAPPLGRNEGYVYLLWEKRWPNNHSQKEKKSAIMDDFKGKESATLPLSGKCSHKPRFGFPSNVTPGSPAVGTRSVSAGVGQHLLIGWLHFSSPPQHILIGEF